MLKARSTPDRFDNFPGTLSSDVFRATPCVYQHSPWGKMFSGRRITTTITLCFRTSQRVDAAAFRHAHGRGFTQEAMFHFHNTEEMMISFLASAGTLSPDAALSFSSA